MDRFLRDELLSRDNIYREDALVSVAWLPFDERRLYWQEDGKLLNEKRADFKQQVFPGSLFLACTQRPRKDDFPSPVVVSSLGSYYLFDPYASYLPLWIRQTEGFRAGQVSPNLNPDLLRDLCALCGESLYESDAHTSTKTANKLAENVFYHLLAVLWSPAYRKENEAALRQDWPRVPIPADLSLLETSANLGRQIADLLLPDREVPGVTTGKLRPELRTLAIPSKLDGSMIEDPADTKVDANWGFFGQKNAVMCGKGHTTPFVPQGALFGASSSVAHASSLVAPSVAAKPRPSSTAADQAPDAAANSLNIWINDNVYWANIPADVWKMTVGGYPVIKKWLSYREYKVLGRALKSDEIAHVTNTVRRLKALLLLGDALDDNYRAAAKTKQLSCSRNKTPVA